MHRTHLGNLQQSGPLGPGQHPRESKSPLHPIEPARFRLALGTIGRMNPGMSKAHDDLLEGPILSSRVQRDRHRRSAAQAILTFE